LVSALASYRSRVTVDHEGRTPVYLQIAAILRDRIDSGELAPGKVIPSETTLMQEHGVARLTARKAVRVLASEGLVEVVTGRGAYVVPEDERPR
jgi:GntR family transcriptional regulator